MRAHVAKLAWEVLLIYYVKCNHESVQFGNVLLLSTLQLAKFFRLLYFSKKGGRYFLGNSKLSCVIMHLASMLVSLPSRFLNQTYCTTEEFTSN